MMARCQLSDKMKWTTGSLKAQQNQSEVVRWLNNNCGLESCAWNCFQTSGNIYSRVRSTRLDNCLFLNARWHRPYKPWQFPSELTASTGRAVLQQQCLKRLCVKATFMQDDQWFISLCTLQDGGLTEMELSASWLNSKLTGHCALHQQVLFLSPKWFLTNVGTKRNRN